MSDDEWKQRFAEFTTHLEDHPDDFAFMLVFADWLEENAIARAHAELGYALRWCAMHKRHPRKLRSGIWRWYFAYQSTKPWTLRDPLFESDDVFFWIEKHVPARSWFAAMEHLANHLDDFRRAVALTDPDLI